MDIVLRNGEPDHVIMVSILLKPGETANWFETQSPFKNCDGESCMDKNPRAVEVAIVREKAQNVVRSDYFCVHCGNFLGRIS